MLLECFRVSKLQNSFLVISLFLMSSSQVVLVTKTHKINFQNDFITILSSHYPHFGTHNPERTNDSVNFSFFFQCFFLDQLFLLNKSWQGRQDVKRKEYFLEMQIFFCYFGLTSDHLFKRGLFVSQKKMLL